MKSTKFRWTFRFRFVPLSRVMVLGASFICLYLCRTTLILYYILFYRFIFYLRRRIGSVRAMCTGRTYVYRRGDDFCNMLAAISHVLRVRLSQASHYVDEQCAALVSRILLAGNGQQYGEPDHLLLDESPISTLFPTHFVLLLFSHMENG